jgi:glycosyltransferase involved in cell wall biosynthesis
MSSLIDRLIFITADTVGTETGGGKVTYHESKALFDLSSNRIVNDRDWLSVLCHNYTIISPDPWRWDDAALEYFQIHTQLAPKLAHFYAGTFSKTINFLKRKGTRISYTAAAHSIEKSNKAHEMCGVPFNYPHLTEPKQWERYVRGYLDADLLICPSTHSANVMRGYGYTKPIRVIPHGVDVPDRAKLSPCPERFRVGYLGSYGCDKFWWQLLAAWKQCNWRDATLVLGGRDSKSDFVTSFIKSHEISNVECVGWVDSITDFYNRISLYVQPSLSEGFGCEVLEAMAHERPVLCSTGAGAADVVPESWTYEPEDLNELVAKLQIARQVMEMRSPLFLSQWRLRAEKYSWDKVRKLYVEAWKELLS